MTNISKKVNGLILAGGKSVRMGHDKGLISYHGKPQREFLLDFLKKYCDHVYLSCKERKDIPSHLNPLPDLLDLDSPLNGVISAFRLNDTVAWLTVPVDMPLIDDATIIHLLAHRDSEKVATCFYDSDGKNPEPLLTLWEPRAKTLLEKYYQDGNKGIKYFLLQHNIHLIKVPDKRIHLNINSGDELSDYLTKKNDQEF